MLGLLENTTFSTAVHRVSNIIEDVRTKFKTSDTRLLNALCDVTLSEEMMSDRSIRNISGEKIPFDPEHRN